jgi:diguanylate cyclase (GGDEF)-like protein
VVSERDLSDILSEFARTMLTDFPIEAILDRLVRRIIDVLPITAAGVTLVLPGRHPRYVAASDAAALCYEKLQSELGEGPCLVTFETGDAVAIPDLGADERFPRFSARAHADGLRAVFTFPLRHGDSRLGALDLYRDEPGDLDAATMVAAQTLADVTSAYLLNARARADLAEAYARLLEASLHDDLTGLPNRALFDQRLGVAMARVPRSSKVTAILFLDLDHFKAVNDTYGHHVGDQLLVAIAARLSRLLRPEDTLARRGGDEFILLCEGLDDRSQGEGIAARIGAALAEPFVISGASMNVSASIGIAFAGPDETIRVRLLEDADAAMYRVKRDGGASHRVIL